MVKHQTVSKLNGEEFRRLTGAEKKYKARGGKPNTLCLEDRFLMTLEYLREYRTYFHIGQSYGVGESVCWRNCRWVEDQLIKNKVFASPGQKSSSKKR